MSDSKGIPKPATVQWVREEVPGVKTIAIAMEDGSSIPYTAGQFIALVFTHHGREERRSYSLSSAPQTDEVVTFTVKRVDNGAYSRLLADRAKAGDKLMTTGASGFFTLPTQVAAYRQVFFFAAGIGITPVFSVIKALLHTEQQTEAVLIYSNRNIADTVFYEALNGLQEKFPTRFRVLFLYSTAFDLSRARLSKSLVRQLLIEYADAPADKQLFYVCGPFPYMRMVIYALEEAGIDSEHIRKENFNTIERNIAYALPPDTATHTVSLLQNGLVHTFPVSYPDTILQAAKKYGLSLPYSCETGRCGSCAAICTSGKVWHSYNEVLMNIELERGCILTCTGHPLGGDVHIAV
ncbi:MAG: ferredoxin--NADP reductase [Taibaiella sp.]|nr:ferredoxin--NADP reductase [Taibaiella sp.]